MRSSSRWLVPLTAAVLGLALVPAAALAGRDPSPPLGPSTQTEAYCMGCHAEPGLTMTLPSGEVLSLTISEDTLRGSVHSPLGIECRACHTSITTYPHPALDYATRRELSRGLYQACEKCHADNYSKTLDSMHAQAATAGNLEAPVCTDCHGSHDVHLPDRPRAHISEICGRCHTKIFSEYADSIHGSALLEEDNPDVPVCTDCHGVHNIQDPRTAQFRVESPEMCAGCHANPELMGRYGLSADVYSLYRLSWHGVDVSVYRAKWPTIWHESAVCTDCHGVHNIRSTEDPQSRVNPKNLLATCQQCHPDAGPNWTGAWTGHNRVSLERTPFVFYTESFYTQLVPVVLGLSAAYVLLQIVRALLDRIRRAWR